ncbi:MAG: aminotransferase class V-fold PLP-dependent enzyme [Bacillota bacterium]|nr:aminotransferase class V-fold PLP-dependent enzyme [Bacillota bacterium]
MDLNSIRNEFPILSHSTYLDNAGIAPIPCRTINALKEFLYMYNYDDGILKPFMEFMPNLLNEIRDEFALLISVKVQEVLPVSTSSEGINIIANAIDWKPGDNVIINDLEFPSNYYPWINLKRMGVVVRVAKSQDGRLKLNDIASLIDKHTRVITATHVAYMTGYRMDLKALSNFARPLNIITVVDATQSLGAIDLNVKSEGIDVVAASGFKWLLSPIGTGLLYIRENLIENLKPKYASWMSQSDMNAKGLSDINFACDARKFMLSGNFDMAAYVGMMTSLRWISELGIDNIEKHVSSFTHKLIDGAVSLGLFSKTSNDNKERAGIVAICVKNPDKTLSRLKKNGIHGVTRLDAIRLSPHFFNTQEEIERVLNVLERE